MLLIASTLLAAPGAVLAVIQIFDWVARRVGKS